MLEFDCAIIRYRRLPDPRWTYEICTEKELEICQYTRDSLNDYGTAKVKAELKNYDWEIVSESKIYLSNGMVKNLGLDER
jgi:hypothetical protein